MLSIKKTDKSDFSKKLNNERVARKINISNELFSRIKMNCLKNDLKIYELLESNLNKVLNNNYEVDNLLLSLSKKSITKKQSFAFTKELLMKVKEYSINENMSMQDIIIKALILK